jgi:RNA polymerase sigma-70 factor (ECF subfamily)
LHYHKSSSDEELRHGCQSGDRRACALLYERYFGKMLGIPMRYSRDRESAVNTLNKAFLKIFQSLDQYEEQGSFQGWMSTIVFRTTMNQIRSDKRNRPPLTNIEDIASPAINSSVEAKLAADDIFVHVQALPDQLRSVFSLHSIDGYTHREIGKLLDISEGNSRFRLSKAKELLRVALSPFYHQNGKTA